MIEGLVTGRRAVGVAVGQQDGRAPVSSRVRLGGRGGGQGPSVKPVATSRLPGPARSPTSRRWRSPGDVIPESVSVAALAPSRSLSRPGWSPGLTGQGFSVKLNRNGAGIEKVVTSRAPGRCHQR